MIGTSAQNMHNLPEQCFHAHEPSNIPEIDSMFNAKLTLDPV